MRLIRLAVLAVGLALSINAVAVTTSGTGLSDGQEAQIEAQIAQFKKQNADNKSGVASPTTVQQMSDWINVGANLGKALASAARELGVAVNDFVNTPVGKITAAIIIWKFLGGTAIHIFGSIVILMFGFVFLWYMNKRVRDVTVVYDTSKKNVFGNYPIKSREVSRLDSDWAVFQVVAAAAILVASMVTLFSF